MPICSYLVIPEAGAARQVAGELSRIPGCEVVPAENHDLLVLITETSDPKQDQALRSRVEGLRGIEALMLTFGEIVSDSDVVDGATDSVRNRRERSS
jgi:nitrate reductase NapAB chaperone NapD